MSILELFEGKIFLEDILNLEIPFVYELIDAKDKLIKEKEKIRREQEAIQASRK